MSLGNDWLKPMLPQTSERSRTSSAGGWRGWFERRREASCRWKSSGEKGQPCSGCCKGRSLINGKPCGKKSPFCSRGQTASPWTASRSCSRQSSISPPRPGARADHIWLTISWRLASLARNIGQEGSMAGDRRYYITTPIYYVNDVPHIGHAYTTLACDAMARFMRLDGYDVRFLTGTDEHGQKIEKSATAAGLDPQAFTDRVSENFRALSKTMGFSNDDFIRTTEERHIRSCQALWLKLKERGEIYLGSYSGWYAVRDEAFYGESELTTRADGRRIAPSGAEAEWVEEPSYFFRLSAWQERLLAFYREHPDFILPESRRNEVISFVSSGLKDLSISRTSFRWGVPVPDDPDHIMYVWLDALTNYITAVGYPDTE